MPKFHLGHTPWNYGVPMRAESKLKMSLSKRGCQSWNKGIKTGPLSEEHKRKCSEAGKRKIFTTEHRANLSKAMKGREIIWDLNSSNPSSLTWKLAEFLQAVGFEQVLPEASFVPYTVDVLLAEEWLGFEADGLYWHTIKQGDPNRLTDEKRDAKLMSVYQLPITRLTEDEVNRLYASLTLRS